MNHWWAFLTGQALHLLVFRRGEWDKRSRDLIIASFALTIASTVALHGASSSSSSSLRNSWWASFRTSATLELAALAGLFTSLLVYRAFFHPLGKFPGPFAARLSNLHLIQLSRRFQLFKEVQQLHEQYGDVVRIGKQGAPLLLHTSFFWHWPVSTNSIDRALCGVRCKTGSGAALAWTKVQVPQGTVVFARQAAGFAALDQRRGRPCAATIDLGARTQHCW